MFQVYETSLHKRRVIRQLDSFDEAEAFVRGMGVVEFQADADFPGCADAFTKDGRVVCVQPAA